MTETTHMVYVYPDFYPDFHCIASACRHSCCKGWEIDIDQDSYEWYKNMEGPFGDRLRAHISGEPSPHFVLREDESCPFLRKDGLCNMILELGEESLCWICTEHPRFYNEFPERLEAGLGLCCEEAVRLLLEGSEPLKLVDCERENGKSLRTESEVEDLKELERTESALQERKQIFSILSAPDRNTPLIRRMENAAGFIGTKMQAVPGIPEIPVRPDGFINQDSIQNSIQDSIQNIMRETAFFYMTLETLDPCWRPMLEQLKTYITNSTDGKLAAPDGIQYERLTEYFIYRHYSIGKTKTDRQCRLLFAFLSTALICALDQANPSAGLPEIIRLYSSEIEYSDENVDAVLRYAEEHFIDKGDITN